MQLILQTQYIMDFGKEDFDLLTRMKELISSTDWDILMERRLDVIQANVIFTEGGRTQEAKENELEVLRVYNQHKETLVTKYKM